MGENHGAHRLALEHAVDRVPIEATDAVQESLYADYMSVITYDDGSQAFVTEYSTTPGEDATGGDPTYAERAVAGEQLFRNIGLGHMVPEQYYDADDGYLAAAAVDGYEVSEEFKQGAWGAPVDAFPDLTTDAIGHLHVQRAAPETVDRVDQEDYMDFAAATLLSGNSDMKGENVMITDDGTPVGIDLDHAGGDFTAHYATGEPWRESHFERGLRYAVAVGETLGFAISRGELLDYTQEFAQDLDPDEAVAGIQNTAFDELADDPVFRYRDSIRENIRAFQDGDFPEMRPQELYSAVRG